MSVETTDRGAAGPYEADHEAHQHAHPSDAKYIKVAVFLAVLTALEVATYFVSDPSTTFLVATLFPMMFVKFAVVAGVFMHLQFDNPLLRRVFLFGLVLAVAVFVVVLTSMEFWSSSFGG